MTRSKPTVDRPATAATPTDLEIVDLEIGEGEPAKPGHTVAVHYVGVAFSNGKEFDSSWNRNSPFDFHLGAGEVIAGWDRGVVGMRVGGRRRLTIPSALAYGDRGAGGVIKPGEHLIFVVDLLSVR
jgi:peptidylprolyl isomerase